MAERRMISRRGSRSKKIAAISYQAEALYFRALPFLDDAGRMTADSEDFRAEVFPLGKFGEPVPLEEIEACIDELHQIGLIGLCECEKSRCLEYAAFSKFQTLQNDRKLNVACKEPNGFQWIPVDSNGFLKGREGKRKLKEGEGETRAREAAPTPPNVEKLISKAKEIKGWAFSEAEDAVFFPRLLADYPEGLVEKVIEDLRTYQEKPDKHYSNLHMALRKWCKQEVRWREERCGDNGGQAGMGTPEAEAPLDDLGRPKIPLEGGWYTQKQIDMMIAEGSAARTAKGYQRTKGAADE